MLINDIVSNVGYRTRERTALAKRIIRQLNKKYEYAGRGLYRVCFKMKGGYILKFPFSEGGEMCNDGEGSIRHETLAKGRYVEYQGFVCVIQEFVQELTDDEIIEQFGEVPDWVNSVDGGQIGTNRKGNLVAYDFVHP